VVGGGDSSSIEVAAAARRVTGIQTVAVKSLPLVRKIRTIGEISYDEGTLTTISAYVDGLSDARIRALDLLEPGQGMRLNLGIGHGTSVQEVLAACRHVTGHAIPAVVAERRAGDPPELVADSRKAFALLGWKPAYSQIEATVETAWRWHRSHPTGYGE